MTAHTARTTTPVDSGPVRSADVVLTTLRTPEEFLDIIGVEVGPSDWLPVNQRDINLFAYATGDEQWIHIDPERAKAGPFGTPVAHGYLTLSLLTQLWSSIIVVQNLDSTVNYGLNKARFPSPVPAGARVRLTATVNDAQRSNDGGIQVTIDALIHREGSDKPVCTAQMLHRYYPVRTG